MKLRQSSACNCRKDVRFSDYEELMDEPMPHIELSSSRLLNNFGNCVQSTIKVIQRRAEGKPDEMVARGIEQVSSMRRIDIKEDTRNHDGLLFEQFFEKCLGQDE